MGFRLRDGLSARRVVGLGAVLLVLAPVASLPVASAAGTDPGPTVVTATGAGPDAKVEVSRTSDLVNQTVAVSWSGFRPSSASRLDNSGDALDVNTENPVRVYQCRGVDPASSSDCYGAPGFRGIEASGGDPGVPEVPAFTYPGQQDPYDAVPDGPANWQDAVTASDGTGEVAVQVFTRRESAALGCDSDTACSLVVVPNYGRPQGATEDQMDAPWAWDRRTVVPLRFLPVGDACPISGDSVRVEGSPVAAHALASWRARTCTLSRGSVRVDYTSIGEPQTRGDVASGTTDVGLVVDPLATGDAAGRGLVYAPVGITGLVVAYQIDDAHGRPVRNLRLNARLVAKLITGSYRAGGDPAVLANPVNIFRDPEFLALNPDVDWPGGAPGNHPLLLGDLSDTTMALTRWLQADAQARAFLDGQPDPWGMRVNSNYKGLDLPFGNFPLLDDLQATTFQPIQEMDSLSRQLSIAQFPGALVTEEGGANVVTKPPRQNPGRREVIGIIDAADAATFRLSTAALRNSAGRYVEPDTGALVTAISHAKVGPDGVTRAVDLTSKDKNAYPLALLVSAALATKAPQAERAAAARLLDYIAGPGQVRGNQVGQLPDGYAPLTSALVAQVRAARTAVLAGYHASAGQGTGTAGTAGGAAGGTAGTGMSPASGTGALPSADTTTSGTDLGSTAAAEPGKPPGTDPTLKAAKGPLVLSAKRLTIGSLRASRPWLFVPFLVTVALLLLLSGPALLLLNRHGWGPRWLRR